MRHRGEHDVVPCTDQRLGELGKERRKRGNVEPSLDDVASIVQPDAENLRGAWNQCGEVRTSDRYEVVRLVFGRAASIRASQDLADICRVENDELIVLQPG